MEHLLYVFIQFAFNQATLRMLEHIGYYRGLWQVTIYLVTLISVLSSLSTVITVKLKYLREG